MLAIGNPLGTLLMLKSWADAYPNAFGELTGKVHDSYKAFLAAARRVESQTPGECPVCIQERLACRALNGLFEERIYEEERLCHSVEVHQTMA